MCGEHIKSNVYIRHRYGSSPRVRGTRKKRPFRFCQVRFIPACAGNTDDASYEWFRVAVHPRVCGEHRIYHILKYMRLGSSPRVRGTRITNIAQMKRMRFIPACAGNTTKHLSPIRGCAVHPRVCGEHDQASYSAKEMTGSSPRVRGTP